MAAMARILTTVVGSYPLPQWLARAPSEQALVDLGASIKKVEGGYDECVEEALRFETETGAPYISSLDDPCVR